MKQVLSSTTVVLPRDVKIELNGRDVTVTGPRGTLRRNFNKIGVSIKKIGARTVRIDMWYGNHKQLACVRTLKSHIDNMVTGVKTGFCYKMRFAYAHFPINVTVTGAADKPVVEVRNFLGERRVRKVKMLPGVAVEKSSDVKDQLVLTGNDIEAVSRSAALVHQSCMVKKKDIRKFLDGIYVAEKGPIGKEMSV